MLEALVIRWIKRKIQRKVRKAMFKKLLKKTKGKLTYGAGITLALGALSQALGIDIAPAEVDVIVSFAATLGVLYGRYRATRGA